MSTLLTESVRSIGAYVSREYYTWLIGEFAEMHPEEQTSAFIPRDLLLSTLSESPRVCGIRFMYAQKQGDDIRSRTILLMACCEGHGGNNVPKVLLTGKGHVAHTGENFSTERCWIMIGRHVLRMSILLPGEEKKDLPRGCFFGEQRLRDLVNREGCAGVRFHFGYNPTTAYFADRYESVLEAVGLHGRSLNVFLEDSQRCPPVCPPSGPGTGSVRMGS